jgi:excisionase family DNA binding protein
MRKFLTLTEAGERLGVSRQQVKKYVDKKRIASVVIAGRVLVDAAKLKKPQPMKPGPKVTR